MSTSLLTGRTENATSVSIDAILVFKKWIFVGFYEIWKLEIVGKLFFRISTYVQTLQLMYLTFVFNKPGYWLNGVSSVMIKMLQPLGEVIDVTNSSNSFICGIVGVGTCIWFTFIAFNVIAQDHTRKRPPKKRLITGVAWLLRLQQTILLQPFLTILLRSWGCPDIATDIFTCGSPQTILKNGVIAASILIMVGFFPLNALFIIQIAPTSIHSGRTQSHGFRAPHGRVEYATTMLRAIATLVIISLEVSSATFASFMEIVGIGTLIAAGIGLVGAYWWYLPFYDMSWNLIGAVTYSIFLWTTIALACAHAVRDVDDYSSLLIWITGMPFLLYSTSAQVYQRILYLGRSKSPLSLSPYVAELQLRLRHITPLVKTGMRLPQVEEFCMEGNVFSSYREALDEFADCSYFQLLVATLVFVSGKKMVFGLNRIKCARELPRQIDLEFSLFCLNMNIREKQATTAGAMSYMEFDKHLHKSRELIVRCLKLMHNFWFRVMNGGRMDELIQSGRAISQASNECRKTIRRLLKISDSSSVALRWHATYVAYVLNDIPTAVNIISRCRAETMENERAGYAVCIISADLASLGKILEVTEATCDLFGYERVELLGRNVKMLCPEPFDAVHDNFIRHFLDEDSDFSTKTRRIYGLHHSGYLIPVDFVITPSTNASGDLILIGTFIERPLPGDTHLLLVNALNFIVTSASEDSVVALGLNPDELFSMSLRITDVLPNFLQRDSSLYYSTERTILVGGVPYGVRARKMEFQSPHDAKTNFHIATFIVIFTRKEKLTEEEETMLTIPRVRSNRFSFSKRNSMKMGASRRGTLRADTRDIIGLKASPSAGQMTVTTGARKRSRQSFLGLDSGPDGESQTSSMQDGLIPLTRQIEILRRRLALNLRTQDPIVAAFSRFSIYFNITCFLTAVLNAFLAVRCYRDFEDEVNSMARVMEEGRLFALVPSYLFHAENYPFPSVLTMLSEAASSLFQLHLDVIDTAHSTSVSKLNEYLYAPNLEMPWPVGESLIDQTSFHMSVLSALNYMNDILEDASNGTLQCETERCEAVNSLIKMEPIVKAQQIADFYSARAQNLLHEQEIIDAMYLGLTCVILVFAFFIGYLPLMTNVSNQRANVRQAFLSIPSHMCSYLKQKALERLRSIKEGRLPTAARLQNDQNELKTDSIKFSGGIGAAKGDHMDANDAFLTGAVSTDSGTWATQFRSRKRMQGPGRRTSSGSGPGSKASSKVAPMQEVVNEAAIPPPSNQDDDIQRAHSTSSALSRRSSVRSAAHLLERMSTVISMATDVRHTRPDRETLEIAEEYILIMSARIVKRCKAAFRIGFTYWCMLAQFWFVRVRDSEHLEAMPSMASAVQVAGLRYVHIHAVMFWAVQPASEEANLQLKENIEKALLYHQALTFGNGTLGVKPFSSTEGSLFELLFTDACDANCTIYSSSVEDFRKDSDVYVEQCLATNLKLGLSFALNDFIGKASNVQIALDAYLLAEDIAIEEQLYVKFELAQAELLDFRSQIFMGEQIDQAMQIYTNAIESRVAEIFWEKLTSLSILAGLLLVGRSISQRVFKELDQELSNIKSLVLGLPTEVFVQVPPMLEILKMDKS